MDKQSSFSCSDLIINMNKLREYEANISTDLKVIRHKLVNPTMITSNLIGSIVDGSSLAKWFHPDVEMRELEGDMQHNVAAFDESHLSLFESLAPEKPDNLRVRLPSAQELKRVSLDKFWELLNREKKLLQENETETERRHNFFTFKYFHPQVLRKIMQHVMALRDEKHEDTLALVSALFGVDIELFKAQTSEELPERGTALTTTIKISHKDTGRIVKLSIDHVGAFFCSFWPEVARDFTTRRALYDRKDIVPRWPDPEVRRKIVESGCDVVPKPSYGGDVNTEFRWSFARAESALMRSMSDQQRRAFYIFKIIFYKDIKPLDNSALHSYWVKTNMFWFCELHDATDVIWCDENLLECVRQFFAQLRAMVSEWRLPHFFIPAHSLLKGPRPEADAGARALQTRLVRRLEEVVESVERFVPSSSDFQLAFSRIQHIKPIVHDLRRLADLGNVTF